MALPSQPPGSQPTQQPKGRADWRLVVIGLLGGLVMAAAGVAVLLSVGGSDDTASSATNPAVGVSTTIAVGGPTSEPPAGTGDPASTTTSLPIPSPNQHWIMVSGHVAGQWTGADWSSGASLAEVDDENFIELESGELLISEPPRTAEFCWFEDGEAAPWFETEPTAAPFGPLAISDLSWPTRLGDAADFSPAAAHVASVESWLDSVGIGDEPVTIERALRFDIENDGVDEVLLVAQHGDTWLDGSTPGTYSALILRRVGEADQVIETVLASDFAPHDAPPVPGFPDLVQAWVGEYSGVELLDLNGDGRLELLTGDFIYEGWTWRVYELGPQPTEVLVIGCGA